MMDVYGVDSVPSRYMIHTYRTSDTNMLHYITVEMRMVRWMCGIKLKDTLPSKEL